MVIATIGVPSTDIVEKWMLTKNMESIVVAVKSHVLLHVSVHQRNMRWIRMVIATIGVPSTDIVEKKMLTKKMESIVVAVQVQKE